MHKRNFFSYLIILILIIGMVPAIPVSASPSSHPNSYTNTGDLRKDIIGVAATQIGYREGSGNDTKYGDWYGLPKNPWCAMFVSWCADQANVPTSILKKSAKASPLEGYFDIPYYKSGYTPKAGDLFFEKSFSHVGFVYKVDGEYFYTIEGNSNGSGSNNGGGVVSNRRRISSVYFASPAYEKDRGVTLDFDLNGGSVANGSMTYDRYEVLSSDGIKLRSGAGTNHSKLTALPKGTKFTVTEKKNADGYTWGKTTFEGKNGWCVISESWTKKIGTVSAVPYKTNDKGQLLDSSSGGKITRRISASSDAVILPDAETFGIERKGYTFAGWSISEKGGKFFQKGKAYTAVQIAPEVAQKNAALSLYAVWMPAELQVSYHANGAYIRSDAYRIDANLLYKANAAAPYQQKWSAGEYKANGLVNCATFGLYKRGHTFKGWSTQPSGAIIHQDAAMTAEQLYAQYAEGKKTLTLYAIWEVHTLAVQYHANGGAVGAAGYQSKSDGIYKSGALYQQKWTYNEPRPTGLVNDSTFGLSRQGYRFIGWSAQKSGAAVFHMDDTTLLPIEIYGDLESKVGVVTLYAIWVPASHTHHFTNYCYNHNATATTDGSESALCSCGATDIREKAGTKLKDSSAFKDVAAGDWYKHSMDYAYTFGLMSGDGKNNLLPKKTMTRAEFVQLLANFSGASLSQNAQTCFSDVPADAWYAPAVQWAVENGIVNGTSANTFSPDGLLSREQLCTMLIRFAKSEEISLALASDYDHFTDEEFISAWAKADVYACARAGVIGGVSENEFAPVAKATRAEAATLMMRFRMLTE